jgi:hypothetical protein
MKGLTRVTGLLLAVCLLAGLSPVSHAAPAPWDGTVAESFAGGSGTESDPYRIETGAQLALLAKLVNEGNEDYNDACYVLTADIDLNGSEEQQWTPIGTVDNPFRGQFDGEGCSITGVYIDSWGEYNIGLFGYLEKGTIRNVTVYGAVKGMNNVGGVVGLNDTGLVENCRNYASVSGSSNIGGVVGRNRTKDAGGDIAMVADCVNAGPVEGSSSNLGGVVGTNYANRGASWVVRCINIGQVAASSSSCEYIGGVVGYNCVESYGVVLVSDCYNTGVVARFDRGGLPYGKYVGGVVGRNRALPPGTYVFKSGYSDPSAVVRYCYNLAPVEGMDTVGGLVGSTAFNSGHTSCSVLGCRYLKTDAVNAELIALYRSGGTGSAKVDDYTGPLTEAEFSRWDSFPEWDREAWTMGDGLSGVAVRPVLKGVEEPEKQVVPVTEITLRVTELPMVIGETDTLRPSVQPKTADSTYIWTSSDPAVAEVDETGKVTAKAEGTAEITVTAGGCSAVCTVIVGRGILYDLYVYYESEAEKNIAGVCVYVPEELDGMLIFASYAQGGALLSSELLPVTPGEYDYPEYEVPEGAETVRAFLVDETWTPLAPRLESAVD